MRAILILKHGLSLTHTVPFPPLEYVTVEHGETVRRRKLRKVSSQRGVDLAFGATPAVEDRPPVRLRLVRGTFEPKRPEDLAIYQEEA